MIVFVIIAWALLPFVFVLGVPLLVWTRTRETLGQWSDRMRAKESRDG